MPTILASSREASTQTTYIGAFNRFAKWAKSLYNVSVLPASKETVSVYLLGLAQERKSISSINQSIYALSWIHHISGFENPTANFMVQTILDGIKRIHAAPVIKKLPITSEILESMYS